MPRLTNDQYIIRSLDLNFAWYNEQHRFAELSGPDQAALHSYFRPADFLTPNQLLVHRRAITAEQPSLPHRAGRAYRHYIKPVHRPLVHMTDGGRTLRVRAIRQPQPDLRLLSTALLMHVRDQARVRDHKSHPYSG